MAASNEITEDVTVVGRGVKHVHVSAWDCALLQSSDSAFLGETICRGRHEVLRVPSQLSSIRYCLEGSGFCLLPDGWGTMEAGQLLIYPPGFPRGLRSEGRRLFHTVWFNFEEPFPLSQRHVDTTSPMLVSADGSVFALAVQTLLAEWQRSARPDIMAPSLQLILLVVGRLLEPYRPNPLLTFWDATQNDLTRDWDLQMLARQAGTNIETLRQETQRHFGRSPLQHLTFLRMQKARELLRSTDWPLERIANEIGYKTPFALSRAFKRENDLSPSRFRSLTRA
jgi:AraC-like DNA-binding protein